MDQNSAALLMYKEFIRDQVVSVLTARFMYNVFGCAFVVSDFIVEL